MSFLEQFLEPFAINIARAGILPEYGSAEYYGYGPAADQYGDVRDCDDDEERRKFEEIFCGRSPTPPVGKKI